MHRWLFPSDCCITLIPFCRGSVFLNALMQSVSPNLKVKKWKHWKSAIKKSTLDTKHLFCLFSWNSGSVWNTRHQCLPGNLGWRWQGPQAHTLVTMHASLVVFNLKGLWKHLRTFAKTGCECSFLCAKHADQSAVCLQAHVTKLLHCTPLTLRTSDLLVYHLMMWKVWGWSEGCEGAQYGVSQ